MEGKDELITTRNFIAEDGRKRTEQPSAGGITTIFDTNGFIRLVLIVPTKTALVSKAREEHAINAGQMFLEWLQALKKLGDKPDKELGQKQLDGKRVTGFVATQGERTFTMWVDSATGELVSIEYDSPVNDKPAHITMTDFRFNERLDESLFSFDVPAGYKVHQPSGVPSNRAVRDAIPGGETSVIEALRGYTKRDGGKFPPSLTDWGPWAVLFSKDVKGGALDPRGRARDGPPWRRAAIPGFDAERGLCVPGQRQDDRRQGRHRFLVQEVGRHLSCDLRRSLSQGHCRGESAQEVMSSIGKVTTEYANRRALIGRGDAAWAAGVRAEWGAEEPAVDRPVLGPRRLLPARARRALPAWPRR